MAARSEAELQDALRIPQQFVAGTVVAVLGPAHRGQFLISPFRRCFNPGIPEAFFDGRHSRSLSCTWRGPAAAERGGNAPACHRLIGRYGPAQVRWIS
ncbi:putative C4-dicarboxylate transporter [Streptomyces sp. NBRC 110611]|nr:putative C4-dicarboxylate transporter [Streptomyces sp. NBRC 110611]